MSLPTPDPALLSEYGTDEVYLANLEKVAADTILGPYIRAVSRSEWAHPMMSSIRVEAQRAQAAAINRQLRSLEGMRMGSVTENLGGPGTNRARYIRALQTQPYAVHPLLFAGALQQAAALSPEMLGGLGVPVGAGVHRAPPGQDFPDGRGPDPEMAAFEREVTASTSVAVKMGKALAHYELGKLAQNDTPYAVGAHFGESAGRLRQAVGALRGAAGEAAMGTGIGLGEASVGTGKLLRSTARKAGRTLGRAGAGFRDYMSQETQPTPNWGAGLTPAPDVNEYGVPLY